MEVSKIHELISNLELQISEIREHSFGKANLIFSLIQLKQASGNSSSVHQTTTYLDIKNFIITYIKSIEKRDAGYDLLKLDKIETAIGFADSINDEYYLFEFTYRNLKLNGFDEECNTIQKRINQLKTERLKKDKKFVSAFIHQCTYDFNSIALTIFILYIISAIIFLPAPVQWMETFSLSYKGFSDVFLLNHFLNVLGFLTGVENSEFVSTTAITGLIFLVFLKLIIIVFVGNFFLEKIKSILNYN